MKKHWVTITFFVDRGQTFHFSGPVITGMQNGKVMISPAKLFFSAFGMQLPSGTKFKWG